MLRHGRPEDVSARTGVPVARLTALAKTFGAARRAVAVWDQAVAWRTGGLADALAIHALNTLTGRLGRPGGLLVQAPMPALPGPLDGASAGAVDLAKAPLTSTSWPAAGGAAATPAKVLFLYHANPVASAPDAEAARQALASVPLVVSFSPFFDESARYANLLLPDHTYLERWQDALAPAAVTFPVWGVVQPVVASRSTNTRATGDVILDLATRLGGEAAAWARWPSVEDLVRERGMALAGAARGQHASSTCSGSASCASWRVAAGGCLTGSRRKSSGRRSSTRAAGSIRSCDYHDGSGRLAASPTVASGSSRPKRRQRLAKSGAVAGRRVPAGRRGGGSPTPAPARELPAPAGAVPRHDARVGRDGR